MKYLLINTDYPAFLDDLYAQQPGLDQAPYARQLQARCDTLFGLSDFYPRHLTSLGHEVWEIHANNVPMQRAWFREHGLKMPRLTLSESWWSRLERRFRPVMPPLKQWMQKCLAMQIEHFQPDVILNHGTTDVRPEFLGRYRKPGRLIVLQHAANTLPQDWRWTAYDLVISSFQPTLDWFQAQGVAGTFLPLAFEPAVLQKTARRPATMPISFIGSLQPIHQSRVEWLETICRHFDVQVFTPDADRLSSDSPIRRHCHPAIFGQAMFQTLSDSQITLNHHGSIPPFANNMRLYEATGIGTMLITDWKPNLPELFDPQREVLAYRSNEECLSLIQRMLDHPDERQTIAAAGQQRTLKDHTYAQRLTQIDRIIRQRLNR